MPTKMLGDVSKPDFVGKILELKETSIWHGGHNESIPHTDI